MFRNRLSFIISLILMLLSGGITPGTFGAQAKTIAIMYFENKSASSELNPLGKALTQMLITDLSSIKGLQIVERERVDNLLAEIELGELGVTDQETAQKAGKALGADYLVWGDFTGDDEAMCIKVKVMETGRVPVTQLDKDEQLREISDGRANVPAIEGSKKVVATQSEIKAKEIKGKRDDLFKLEQEIIDTIGVALGVDTSAKRELSKLLIGKPKELSIAIMPFENNSLSDKLDSLGQWLADVLITDLSHVQGLNIIERENIDKVLNEMKLGMAGLVEKKKAIKIGKMLGAELMVLGTFMEMADNLRTDVHLVDVDTGVLITARQVTAKTRDFYNLERELVNMLIETFNVKLNSAEKERMARVHIKSLEAAIYYGKGIWLMSWADPMDAVKEFKKCLYLDPDYAPAQFYLAQSYKFAKQWDKAIETYQRAMTLDPENTDFIARCYSMIGSVYHWKENWRQVINYTQKSIDLVPHSRNVPGDLGRIAYSYAQLGELRKAEEIYRRIVDEYPTLGARPASAQFKIAYRIYFSENSEYKDYNKAIEEFQKVHKYEFPNVPQSIGYAANAQYRIGLCYRKLGKLKEALAAFEKLKKKYGFVPQHAPSDYWARMAEPEIADIYWQLGETQKAREILNEIIAKYPKLNNSWRRQAEIKLRAIDSAEK